MPSFDTSGSTVRTPFGKNQYLRSTKAVKTESYMCAAASVTAETIDGDATQKVLQPGEVIAAITSGTHSGKFGPFQRGSGAAGAAAVNEVQSITVDATSGTYTISFGGETTAAIAEAATAAAVQAALEALTVFNPGDITVTGSAGGPYTLTFGGQYAGTNVAQVTADSIDLAGGAGTVTPATVTPGSAAGVWSGAASDGRGDPANIVGINDTFLPWQLMERDVEIAVVYDAAVVQAWCFERDAAGARIALTNRTRDDMLALANLSLRFS